MLSGFPDNPDGPLFADYCLRQYCQAGCMGNLDDEHTLQTIGNGKVRVKLRGFQRDRPTLLYLDRIARFRKNPPPSGWQGVTLFDQK